MNKVLFEYIKLLKLFSKPLNFLVIPASIPDLVSYFLLLWVLLDLFLDFGFCNDWISVPEYHFRICLDKLRSEKPNYLIQYLYHFQHFLAFHYFKTFKKKLTKLIYFPYDSISLILLSKNFQVSTKFSLLSVNIKSS